MTCGLYLCRLERDLPYSEGQLDSFHCDREVHVAIRCLLDTANTGQLVEETAVLQILDNSFSPLQSYCRSPNLAAPEDSSIATISSCCASPQCVFPPRVIDDTINPGIMKSFLLPHALLDESQVICTVSEQFAHSKSVTVSIICYY